MLDSITQNDWNFPVEMQPLFNADGIQAEKAMAVTRTDTNEILGVHSPRYQIVEHGDIIDQTMDAIIGANISKDYKAKFEVFENGAKLRGEVLFPDLTIEPRVGDYSAFRIEFFSSYDGSWAYSNIAQALCLWCLNGATTGHTFSSTKRKHTKNIQIDADSAKIKAGVEDFLGLESKWKEWTSLSVDTDWVENFFARTLAKTFSHTSKPKRNETQLEKLMGAYHEETRRLGKNKWALYNTMTAWATHTEALASPAASRRRRQEQVANAMKTESFICI